MSGKGKGKRKRQDKGGNNIGEGAASAGAGAPAFPSDEAGAPAFPSGGAGGPVLPSASRAAFPGPPMSGEKPADGFGSGDGVGAPAFPGGAGGLAFPDLSAVTVRADAGALTVGSGPGEVAGEQAGSLTVTPGSTLDAEQSGAGAGEGAAGDEVKDEIKGEIAVLKDDLNELCNSVRSIFYSKELFDTSKINGEKYLSFQEIQKHIKKISEEIEGLFNWIYSLTDGDSGLVVDTEKPIEEFAELLEDLKREINYDGLLSAIQDHLQTLARPYYESAEEYDRLEQEISWREGLKEKTGEQNPGVFCDGDIHVLWRLHRESANLGNIKARQYSAREEALEKLVNVFGESWEGILSMYQENALLPGAAEDIGEAAAGAGAEADASAGAGAPAFPETQTRVGIIKELTYLMIKGLTKKYWLLKQEEQNIQDGALTDNNQEEQQTEMLVTQQDHIKNVLEALGFNTTILEWPDDISSEVIPGIVPVLPTDSAGAPAVPVDVENWSWHPVEQDEAGIL